MFLVQRSAFNVFAAPIDPPAGYPKLNLSTKVVVPPLVGPGGATLHYSVEIVNTGAYTAYNASFADTIPISTTYNNDAWVSEGSAPVLTGDTLEWMGDVGFDSSVVISFSVDVTSTFSGTIVNSAVISHPMISSPVSVSAETTVTDRPIFRISKTSEPSKPGKNKPLIYWLTVENTGQPAVSYPITVTDSIPSDTTYSSAGTDGELDGSVVIWRRVVDLDYGETTVFSFTVDVDDVVSGTVISNSDYQVTDVQGGIFVGELYTTTVIDPILQLWKTIYPDPPGSNREMTYTLNLYNSGSMATGLVITDRIPDNVSYVSGGTLDPGNIVRWNYPSLDTDEFVQFKFKVYIGDIADVAILNGDYRACSLEGICVNGQVISNVIHGPVFEVAAYLDPIAKKPGGGGGPVTPTLTIKNLGPGNAIDAQALMKFIRISVSANDLYAIPAIGTIPPFPGGPPCGDKCVSYRWQGSLAVGDMISFTTIDGQSTIGGEQGTIYTATIMVTDTLGSYQTEPITGTATGLVTHYANLIPTKSAPSVIGRGKFMTYTINVWNSGLSTDVPPYPVLSETLPLSVSLVSVSDGGSSSEISGTTLITWALPAMSPGDEVWRSFTVLIDDELVSGSLIVNDSYRTQWFENEITGTGILSMTGEPITTTVIDAGLIDSYKVVTPQISLPGPGVLLNYFLHIVNSSSDTVNGVEVYDILPWEHSTYQRDAVASAGSLISDIVSIFWNGDVGPLASEVISFSVLVDPYYQGAITNSATITHPSLLNEVDINAVANVTTQPVLRISKSAPTSIPLNQPLHYKVTVTNLGQLATNVVISDTIPQNTEYIPGSGSAGAQYENGQIHWSTPIIRLGESVSYDFEVLVNSGTSVINSDYSAICSEGVSAIGSPVVTIVTGFRHIYLPVIFK